MSPIFIDSARLLRTRAAPLPLRPFTHPMLDRGRVPYVLVTLTEALPLTALYANAQGGSGVIATKRPLARVLPVPVPAAGDLTPLGYGWRLRALGYTPLQAHMMLLQSTPEGTALRAAPVGLSTTRLRFHGPAIPDLYFPPTATPEVLDEPLQPLPEGWEREGAGIQTGVIQPTIELPAPVPYPPTILTPTMTPTGRLQWRPEGVPYLTPIRLPAEHARMARQAIQTYAYRNGLSFSTWIEPSGCLVVSRQLDKVRKT